MALLPQQDGEHHEHDQAEPKPLAGSVWNRYFGVLAFAPVIAGELIRWSQRLRLDCVSLRSGSTTGETRPYN